MSNGKAYYETNKTKILKKNAEYYELNKEQINEYKKGYNKNYQTINFLGKLIRLLHHDRAPKGYVWHHTCYNHADPEANIVLLSRRSHVIGHILLKELNIEIPHINKEIN